MSARVSYLAGVGGRPVMDTEAVIALAKRYLGVKDQRVEIVRRTDRMVELRAGPVVWVFEVIPPIEVLLPPHSSVLLEASPPVVGGPVRRNGFAITPAGELHDLRTVEGFGRFCSILDPVPEPLSVSLLVCRLLAPHHLDMWPVEVEHGPDSPSWDDRIVRFRSRFAGPDVSGAWVVGRDRWVVDMAQTPWHITSEPVSRSTLERT